MFSLIMAVLNFCRKTYFEDTTEKGRSELKKDGMREFSVYSGYRRKQKAGGLMSWFFHQAIDSTVPTTKQVF